MERITTDDQAVLDKLAEAMQAGGCGDCMPDCLFEIGRTTDSFGSNWGCEPPAACSLHCERALIRAMHRLQELYDVDW